ncbi:MAG: hypothetical protein J6B34_03305 [Clostridia bacterium]|nr:hypothetical protein [Clostridia bacterium]
MRLSKQAEEYRYFLVEHLFKLLSISWENVQTPRGKAIDENYKGSYVYQSRDLTLCFTNKRSIIFELKCGKRVSEDSIRLANTIVECFFAVSKYHMVSGRLKASYYSEVHQNANYKMAIQKGICKWIVGHQNDKIEKLFDVLEGWSVKTYEGERVTLGFIINPNATSDFDTEYGDWCEFLNSDFSATLTDCVNSVIELDNNCNFCNYYSIIEDNCVREYQLKRYLPLEYSGIIEKYVVGDCVGIFLLSNGDIILSKNGQVLFVKRNLKWLNFEYEAFENSFEGYLEENQISKGLLEEIFASMLDVSFSHSGGIIAVVNDKTGLVTSNKCEAPVLSEADYLLNGYTLKQVAKGLEGKKYTKKEIQKRVLRRNVIMSLIKDKTFEQLDRKLRCELISSDGACIIDSEGRICSVGAIIKTDGGSLGGGRGSAARKLSRYGFAIKISTDGYIELYIDGKKVYAIK